MIPNIRVQDLPGPGHYHLPQYQTKSGISMSFKESTFSDPLTETPFRVRFLGKELQKLENQGVSSPGPKYHVASNLLDGPSYSFALPKSRTEGGDDDDNGERIQNTNGRSSLHRSFDAINVCDRMYLGYGMNGARTRGLDSPGPMYVPDDSVTRKNIPKHSFGTAKRAATSHSTSRQREHLDIVYLDSHNENPGLRALSTTRSVTGLKMGPKSKHNCREKVIMRSLTRGLGKDSPGCKYLPKNIDSTSKFCNHSGTRFGGLA